MIVQQEVIGKMIVRAVAVVVLSFLAFQVRDMVNYYADVGMKTYRGLKDEAPIKCRVSDDQQEIARHVDRYLLNYTAEQRQTTGKPQMILLLGGSGTGKTIAAKHFLKDIPLNTSYVLHGLDDYLPLLPEFSDLFLHPKLIYKSAAQDCYPAVIPIAKVARDTIIARKLNVVYEETGKDQQRLIDRVIKPFMAAGYEIHAILVNAHPNVAVVRAWIRFLETGRYAPEEYVRASFPSSNISDLIRSFDIKLTTCQNDCVSGLLTPVAAALQRDCLVCTI